MDLNKVVEVDQACLRVGTRTLIELPTLSIKSGERIAIVGPNGAGKSTLLKLLAGMVRPTSGTLNVLGHDLSQGLAQMNHADQRQFRTQCGLLMQNLPLVGRLSALENVMIGALANRQALPVWRSVVRLYPMSLRQRALTLLDSLGARDLAPLRADRLSGGERQKVALARLSLQNTKLILADEPTSALDPSSTRVACQFLNEIQGQAAMVTVVHDLDLLPLLADRVIGLSNARLVFNKAIADITESTLRSLYETTPAQVNAARTTFVQRSPRFARSTFVNLFKPPSDQPS